MAEPTIKKKFYAEDDTTVVLIKGYGEGGGGGGGSWADLEDKPFDAIGFGLTVDENKKLKVDASIVATPATTGFTFNIGSGS